MGETEAQTANYSDGILRPKRRKGNFCHELKRLCYPCGGDKNVHYDSFGPYEKSMTLDMTLDNDEAP